MTEDYKECGWNNNGNCLAYPDMCAEIDDCEHKQLKRLEQENKDLKKQIESDKGLITIGGKQQYEYLQRIDELKKTVENQKLEYEELQCDLSEVENACGCYQSENAELKQENKDLKDNNNQLQAIIDDGRAENKRFREENKELKERFEKRGELMCNCAKQRENYRSALEEIRKVLTNEYYIDTVKAIHKINEVLNEKEL